MTAKKLTRSHRDQLVELRGRLRVIADEVGNEVQQYAMLITHAKWWQFASPFALHMDNNSGNIPVVLLPKGFEPQKVDDQSGVRQPCNPVGDDDGDDEVEVFIPPRIIGLPDEASHVHLSVSGFPVGDESDMGFLYAWDCDTSAHSVSQLTNFSLIHTYRSLLLAGRILPHAPNPHGTARHLPKRPVRNLALVEWACLALAYCRESPDYGFRVDVSVAKRIGDDLIDWNADPALNPYNPISYLSLSWKENQGPSKARRELREEWPELIVAKVIPHYPRSLIGPITETLLKSEEPKRQPIKAGSSKVATEWVALYLYLKYVMQMNQPKGLTYIRPTDVQKDWHWKYMVHAVESGVYRVNIPNAIKNHSSVSRAYWAVFDPQTCDSNKAEENHRRLVESREVVAYLEKEFKHILKPTEGHSVRAIINSEVLKCTDEHGNHVRLSRKSRAARDSD